MRAVLAASGIAAACSNVRLAEHLVTGAEPLDVAATRLHPTREVRTPDLHLGPAEPERRPRHVQISPHHMPVARVDRGRVNPPSASLSAGIGLSTLPSARTSGEPYRSWTIAFIGP